MGFRVKARSTRSKVVRRWMKHINVRRRTMPAVLACNLHHVLDGPRQRQETPSTLRLPFFPLLPHTLVCLLLPPPLYTRLTMPLIRTPIKTDRKGATTTNTHTSTTQCTTSSLTPSSTRISSSTVDSLRRAPMPTRRGTKSHSWCRRFARYLCHDAACPR